MKKDEKKNLTRTYNTLFMLMSIDGKISTGINSRYIDADSKHIESLLEGRYQYDDLVQKTDLASLNTGKVMAKVGWNDKKEKIDKIPVEFIIVDNKPHLDGLGVRNLLRHVKKLYIVTTNINHPAYSIEDNNLEVIRFDDQVDFSALFILLKSKGIERVTVQSGGTLNSVLIREDFVDELSLVVAPIMVGGEDTPSLEDGTSIVSQKDLSLIKEFEIIEAKVLDKSYLNLRYKRK